MNFSLIDTQAERFVQITLHGGQTRIFASGPIEIGDTDRFLRFVQSNRIEWAVVYLDSPGGSLAEGLRLGRAIRDLRFDTTVGQKSETHEHGGATCASACAYVFAGGLNRFFRSADTRLGLHQFYAGQGDRIDASDAQIVSAVLVDYFQTMGVDAAAFVRSVSANASGMVWLTPAEAATLGLANNGTQPSQATIRMSEGRPYLRLEQTHHDVTSRILLMCDSSGYSILAGIVTDPETSLSMRGTAARNYLELDRREFLPMAGDVGMSVQDSVLWIDRDLSDEQMSAIESASEIAMWLDGHGAMRWGASLDLQNVRTELSYFLQNCR